jgi:acetyl-CoA carboxylase biotin carboxyl carrier protein
MDGNELSELRELVEFLKASGIAEFEYEKGDLKLGLKFEGAAGAGLDLTKLAQLMASSQPAPVVPAAAPVVPVAAAPAAPVEEKFHLVKSPIVGTFYESPSPGSPPFVKVGDVVEVGQVLCIVEAMKLMNEIESDAAGEIVERIAVGGQPVEYGQGLFAIRAK